MANEQEEEKSYEVKDKRRVNPDGTLREDAAAEAPETAQPEEQAGEAAQEAGPAEEQEAQEPTEEQPTEQAEAQEAEPEAPGERPEMPPPDIYAMLQFVFGLLAEQAWQLMGIHLAPGQKEPVRDMAQAKVAIDTVIFISDKLQPHVTEDERRALRSIISDLQMNFVSHG